MESILQEEIEEYPWVTFALLQQAYCVSSRYINAIMVPTEIFAVPESPPTTKGVISLYGKAIEIIDLRVLFHLPSLSEDLASFATMKALHLEWVKQLSDSVNEDREFTLATNPHKCKFGMWFDKFTTDSHSLRHILNRIDEPHQKLHRCAVEMDDIRERANKKEIKETLDKANDLCSNQIVPLLDKLISTYAEVNRGIIIILEAEGSKVGIFADQVTGTKVFQKSDFKLDKSSHIQFSSYIQNMISPPDDSIYMEIDVLSIMKLKNPKIDSGFSLEESKFRRII